MISLIAILSEGKPSTTAEAAVWLGVNRRGV